VARIDWTIPVICVGCGKECRKPNRQYDGDPSNDPRVIYSDNGRCNTCAGRSRREAKGWVPEARIDWSTEVHCIECKKELRRSTTAPDGRTAYGAKGLCINCFRIPIRRASGAKPAKFVKFDETHQECSGCLRWLARDRFAVCVNNNTRSGLRTVCTFCISLQGNYKLTFQQYNQLLSEANYMCQACGRSQDQCHMGLVIDHDHSCCAGTRCCGKCLRGIICSNCNTSIGNLKDSSELVSRAIEYLVKAKPILIPVAVRDVSRNLTEDIRYCGDCKRTLPRNLFYKAGSSVCKRCQVYRNHGISHDIYSDLLRSQNGSCGICNTLNSETHRGWLQIDHDHECCAGGLSCGTCVRGLLCGRCNSGIGLIGDSVDRLRSIKEYLDRTEAERFS